MKHPYRLMNPEITVQDAMMLLADGNPGAIRAMCALAKCASTADPGNFLGPFGPVFLLDSAGIYGSAIWILYKDVCGENAVRTLAVLRSGQLGIIPAERLTQVISAHMERTAAEFDADLVWTQVCERLPAFQKPGALE
jgi:hypothetical protein